MSDHEHEEVGDGSMYPFEDQSRTCRICWQVYFPKPQPEER